MTEKKRFLLLHLAVIALSSPLAAGERLAWKLKTGDEFRQVVDQKLTTEVKGAPVAIKSETSQRNEVDWKIAEVTGERASVLQKVVRLRMETKTSGRSLLFDSAQDDQDLGPLAGRLGPMLRTLSKAEFRCSMSPSGKVTEIKFPDEVLQALQSAVGGATVISKESLLGMVRSAASFPERELSMGDTWSQELKTKLAQVGTMIRTTTYKYEGEQEFSGGKVSKISLTVKIAIEPTRGKTASSLQIEQQKSTGTILFDNKQGHLVKSDMDVSYTASRNISGAKVSQTVRQVFSVSMKRVSK